MTRDVGTEGRDLMSASGLHHRPSAFVTPLARSLAMLSAFSPQERWLKAQDIALRTETPLSTVNRLMHTLVALGYVHYSAPRHSYRLTAAVLSLGYAAIAYTEIQRRALPGMQALANESESYVVLGSRDRLDVVILESCRGQPIEARADKLHLPVSVGSRFGIARSPLGWAMFAPLPELEQSYLSSHMERKLPRDWPRSRRRMAEAVSQIRETGYCTALGEWEADIAVVAAPLLISGWAPMALACIGSSARLTRARIERDLSRRLLRLVSALQEEAALEE